MRRLLPVLGSLCLSLAFCQKSSSSPVEDDVWILTNASLHRVQERLLFHYDGSRWTDVTAQLPGKARDSIYPISKDDVWAVGKQGTAAHFDGKRWTPHRISNFDWDLVDVFARPGDVWAAAAGPRAVHYDGKKWSVLTPKELAGSSMHVVWGTASQVLIPVNSAAPPARMARFDGSKWSAEPVGPGGVTLVHGSAPNDIWALSRRGQGYHFDGTSWIRVPTHDSAPLWSLSVAGPRSAYAAGDDGVILRWDGRGWQRSPTGTLERLVSVYAPANGKALAGGAKLYRQK
jgi:hypothetical protein